MFRIRQPEPQRAGFSGVWAAAVTPHRAERYEADFGGVLELVDRLSGSGVDGIVLLGATGEFLNIKIDERTRLVHLAVKRSRVPVMVGVGHSTLEAAVSLAGAAVDSGAAALLLMPPYFYRYSDDQLIEFYRMFAVAIQGALPIFLYNIPAFTNPISLRVARELLLDDRFAGIKDSSGDPDHFSALAELREERPFGLFCGNDRLIPLAHGCAAAGVVSGVACAVPELVVALHRALQSGASALAGQLYAELLEFIQWIERFPVPVGIAVATEARGIRIGPPSVPYAPRQFEEIEEFKSWFRQWLPAVLNLPHARSITR